MKANTLSRFLLCTIAFTGLCSGRFLDAQELKKVRSDYFSGPIAYSPSDPWTRSKVFQSHTGHSGLFYNCDGEECKRNSPYINWTTNCQPLWPERLGFVNGFRRDMNKIKWRINNGGCGCQDCQDGQTCNACLLAESKEADLKTASSHDSTKSVKRR